MNTADSLGIESPWPGLSPFREADFTFFRGREEELDKLLSLIAVSGFVVLHGASGTGKSSLLRAGLTPKLRDQGCVPVFIRFSFSEDTPSYRSAVLLSLAHALEAAGRAQIATFPNHLSLWEIFHDPVFGLVGSGGEDPATVVFLFDQFEELYTLGDRDEHAAHDFLEDLVALVENYPLPETQNRIRQDYRLAERLVFQAPSPKVVLNLRSDYFARLDREPLRRCAPSRRSLELREMTGLKAFDAVWAPASASSIVDRETAAAIVRFAAGVPTSTALEEIRVLPANLALCCYELDSRRRQTGASRISLADLEGMHNLFEDFYERCFQGMPRDVRFFVEDELITTGGQRYSVIMQDAISRLTARGIGEVQARTAIQALVGARLLAVHQYGEFSRLELSHDALAQMASHSRESRHQHFEMIDAERFAKVEEALFRARRKQRLALHLLLLAILAILGLCALIMWLMSHRVP
jgi:hypothetical protein